MQGTRRCEWSKQLRALEPGVARRSGDEDTGEFVFGRDDQIWVGLAVKLHGVVLGAMVLDQSRFKQQGFPLRLALYGVDVVDFFKHPLLPWT